VKVLGRVGRAPALALWVDRKVHAAEGRPVSQQIVAGRATGIAASGLAAWEPMVTVGTERSYRRGLLA